MKIKIYPLFGILIGVLLCFSACRKVPLEDPMAQRHKKTIVLMGDEDNGGGGDTSGSDSTWISLSGNIPPNGTSDVQVRNTCAFKTMEWVSKYYGGTLKWDDDFGTYYANYKNINFPDMMDDLDTYGISPALRNIVINNFFNSTWTSIQQGINNGHPIMGEILISGNDAHELMCTGYKLDPNLIIRFFDPQDGNYQSVAQSGFYNRIEITGLK